MDTLTAPLNPTSESVVLSNGVPAPANLEAGSDRRADVDRKQNEIAALLQEQGCEGLLILEPENFSWLTSGGSARGVLHPEELPVLYYTLDQRWVLCSNVDSQRLFDEEINGLGFQLKEWPWHWGREQLLTDLCGGRKVVADRAFGAAKVVAAELRRLRLVQTIYEQACSLLLGPIVSHALEATCRTMVAGTTEREIAAQISHRLLQRGVLPLKIEVAADGRSRRFRQCGFTSQAVERYCVVAATGRKYGLCATASRSVSFGDVDPGFRKEHDAAARVCATYLASSWPDAVPQQIFTTAKHVYRLSGFEYEWRLSPQGHLTGRLPVELTLTPQTAELFQAGCAVTWHASVGAAFSTDTFLITEQGPRLITATELWPLKRIKVQGAEFFRPDIFILPAAAKPVPDERQVNP
jgi:hypothetical protein